MSLQNVEAVRGLYDAFNRGDLDTFERGVARGLEWNEADNSIYSSGNPYRGFPAVRDQIFAATKRDFDDFACELEQLLDAGDQVVGTGRYRGKCKATGKPLSAQFCHVFHVDSDGKLDRMQEYTDTLHMAQVTGRAEPAQQAEQARMPEPAI